MRWRFFLFFIIFSFGLGAGDFVRKSFSQTVSPKADKTEKIVLDRDKVCIPCPPGHRPQMASDCDGNMSITVSASESGNGQFKYEYTVSGGRIIGAGEKVTWDMTGSTPGTYQIRVDVEDYSKRQKRTETATSTVLNSDCGCGLCVCPTLSVVASASPTPARETMIFTANVSGGNGEMITYLWTISDGEIVEGQGTPVLRVATDSKMVGKTVKATVEIGGVCEECNKTESADGAVAKVK